MAAANHMPQLKQYCSGMFKREDWEVIHLHKLIEKEYKNQTIQMPVEILKSLQVNIDPACLMEGFVIGYSTQVTEIDCVITHNLNYAYTV